MNSYTWKGIIIMEKGTIFKFHNDLDTDQIIASQYLLLPNLDEMKGHAFESLDPDFAKKVKPGDFVVGGENFGCGSSREQAPGVLKALGVQAVIAKSFARIFFRNAINIGLPSVKIFRMMYRPEIPWNFICPTVQQLQTARHIPVPNFRNICREF